MRRFAWLLAVVLPAGCGSAPSGPSGTNAPPTGEVLIHTFDGINGSPVTASGPRSVVPGSAAVFTGPQYLDRATLVPNDGQVSLWPITVDERYVRTIVYETWSFAGTQRLFRWNKPSLGIPPGTWQGARDEIASTGAVALHETAQPDIEISVDPNAPDLVGYQGFTRCTTTGYVIDHCRIVLRSAAVAVSPILTHELGHCLGLGHSPRSADLMAPSQSRNARFTADERVLLTMMYVRRRPGNAPPDEDQSLGPLVTKRFVLEIVD